MGTEQPETGRLKMGTTLYYSEVKTTGTTGGEPSKYSLVLVVIDGIEHRVEQPRQGT